MAGGKPVSTPLAYNFNISNVMSLSIEVEMKEISKIP